MLKTDDARLPETDRHDATTQARRCLAQVPDTGADDEDVLPAKLLGTAVVGGVQLAAGEGGCSGVVRPEQALPGAGGVDDGPAW